MALGTLTLVKQAAGQGPIFYDRVSCTGDAAYPTGGTAAFETTYRAKVGSSRTIIDIIPGDCGLFVPSYTFATKKLKVRNFTDGTEVTDTTNLGSTTFNFTVVSE
jgi:hypothetical protein